MVNCGFKPHKSFVENVYGTNWWNGKFREIDWTWTKPVSFNTNKQTNFKSLHISSRKIATEGDPRPLSFVSKQNKLNEIHLFWLGVVYGSSNILQKFLLICCWKSSLLTNNQIQVKSLTFFIGAHFLWKNNYMDQYRNIWENSSSSSRS